jgi:hypothetical protein
MNLRNKSIQLVSENIGSLLSKPFLLLAKAITLKLLVSILIDYCENSIHHVVIEITVV